MDPANRFPRQLYLLLVLLAAIQSLHYYPLLPATVASHFDGRGEPNGWQAKDVFLGFYWGAIMLTAILSLAIPKLVAWAPASLINLPNKGYWLAPGSGSPPLLKLQRRARRLKGIRGWDLRERRGACASADFVTVIRPRAWRWHL